MLSQWHGEKKLVNEEEDPTLLLTLKDEDKDVNCSWYLDNSASNHMCQYNEKFVKLNENVSFRDSSKVQIEVNCTIVISSKMEVISWSIIFIKCLN